MSDIECMICGQPVNAHDSERATATVLHKHGEPSVLVKLGTDVPDRGDSYAVHLAEDLTGVVDGTNRFAGDPEARLPIAGAPPMLANLGGCLRALARRVAALEAQRAR